MKRAILCILFGAALGVGGLWLWQHDEDDQTARKKAETPKPAEAADKPSVSRDQDGNAVVTLSDELKGNAGIVVAHPSGIRLAPELQGFGRILDPAPLEVLMTELAAAQAAYGATSNELERLKLLTSHGNASARALQGAEASARHDQLALQSANDRLVLSWGRTLAASKDLSKLIEALTSHDKVLARVDLPAGQTLSLRPLGARLVTLSGHSVTAEFLDDALTVDPQTQCRGLLFSAQTDAAQLLPGESILAYVQLPGEPLSGVLIPSSAILRTEGKGWVYLMGQAGKTFTRREIPLDHPTNEGWFVTHGISDQDQLVVTGAQTLLSVELKPADSSAPAD